MKYAANRAFLYAVLCAFFWPCASIASADTCQCATPPGGEIQCPPGTTGFCRIRDGKVHGGCEPTPKGLTGEQLKAWVLSKALGTRVEPDQVRASATLEQAFKEGRYKSPM